MYLLLLLPSLYLLLPVLSQATYSTPCPLLGPEYPAPLSLAAAPVLQEANKNFTQTAESALNTGLLDNGTFFSVEV